MSEENKSVESIYKKMHVDIPRHRRHLHKYHGFNVLVVKDSGNLIKISIPETSINMWMYKGNLREGWKESKK